MIIPKKTFSNFTPADFLNPNKPIEEIEPVADPEHHFKVWGVAPKIFQIVNPFFLLILPKIFKNFSFWEGECKNFSIYDFFLLPRLEIQWVIPFSHFSLQERRWKFLPGTATGSFSKLSTELRAIYNRWSVIFWFDWANVKVNWISSTQISTQH